MKLTYLGYCRKSSEEDTKQIQSISTQMRILREYVSKHNLILVDVYEERKSAKDDGERPIFKKLIQDLKSGKGNALLVAHIDRISRNEIEAGEVIKLLHLGIIKEIRTPHNVYSSVNDLLHLGIEFLFAAEYSRRLSVRVKEGIESKLKKGEYPRIAPLGYLNKDGKIYPDPLRSPLIKEMFKLFSVGDFSIKQLTKKMNDMGLRTKRGGNKVAKSAIHRRLSDPIYYGLINMNGKFYTGIHAPIISKALFDKVQDVLSVKTRPKRQIHDFLYRGYLACNKCGCMLTTTIKKDKYIYYYCTNGRGCCDQNRSYLPEPRVQDLIQSLMDNFSLPGDLAKASLEEYCDKLQSQAGFQETARVSLTSELEAMEIRLGRLEDMFIDERIAPEQYDIKRNRILNHKAELRTQLKHLPSKDLDSTLELLKEFKNQAVNIGEMYKNGNNEVRSNLLKSALWNCKVEDGKITSTRYKKPFAYFEGLSKCTDLSVWRR